MPAYGQLPTTKPGQKMYPDAVHDIRAAVQFIRGRAKDFRSIRTGSRCGEIPRAPIWPRWWRSPATPRNSRTAIRGRVRQGVAACAGLIGTYGIYDVLTQWRSRSSAIRATIWWRVFSALALRIARSISMPRRSAMRRRQQQDRRVPDLGHRGRRGGLPQSVAGVPGGAQAGGVPGAPLCGHGAPHYWLSYPIDEPGSHSGFVAPRLASWPSGL